MTDPPVPEMFSQEQLNAVAARERTSATAAAKAARDTELAGQWGIPIDQVQATLDAAKAAADKDKSDATRAREAADTERAAAVKERADAAAERHATRVERQLLRAGVPADNADLLTDAVTLIRVPADADDKTLADAIEAVKGRHPAMFTVKTPDPKPYGGVPDPGAPPSGRPPVGPASNRDPRVTAQLARRGIGIQQAS